MSDKVEQLKQAIEDYQEILLCKKRLDTVKHELITQEAELQRLKIIVDEEHQDVLFLENRSLKQLFTTLLLNKEAQLDKERQEYLLVAMKHNECHNLLELLSYEKKVLQSKVRKTKKITRQLEEALDDFTVDKKTIAPVELVLLKSFNEELKNILQLKVESKEALKVINDLKASFKQILKALKSAKIYDEWGYFYKEKQQAKVKKEQFIDIAHSHIHIVKKQLIFLRSELLDMEEFQGAFSEAQMKLSDFNLAYYHDLITDWINVLKLNETIDHTMTSRKTITKIGTKLKKLIKKTDEEYLILMIKRETLIDKISV